MISILLHKGKIFWPWGAVLPDVNLELIGEEEITYNKEMREGDYENLLEVFDKNFGSFVILER